MNRRVFGLACLLASLHLAAPAAPVDVQPGDAPLPWGAEESLAVELLTVSFYAVGADGKPVFDLRRDEVSLAVGGQRVAPDTFDGFARHGEREVVSSSPASGTGAATPAAPRSRNVVVLLDRAFMGPEGWRNGQRAASDLVDGLGRDERVSLLINDAQRGLTVDLWQVAADREGKRRFRAGVQSVLPSVERLEARAEGRIQPYVLGTGRNGVPTEQVHNAYEAGGALARAEYRAVGYDLAENLELLAALFSRSAGPKLLVLFSGGIDRTLFFEGEIGFRGVGSSGSSESAHVDTRRAEPMIERFHRAYQSLAAAGVNTVVVDPRPGLSRGRDMLAHLAHSVGGLLVEDPNPVTLQRRLEAVTSARYEIGVYAQKLPAGYSTGEATVVVTRPGVTVHAPRRLPSRKRYRELSPAERKLLIVDFVQGSGPQTASGANLARPLSGQVRSTGADGGERRLRFEAERPAAVASKPVDLYDVLVRLDGARQQPELVSYQERLGVKPGEALGGEARFGEGSFVWAILAVEPESGNLYLRRLQLVPPPAGGGR